MSPTETDNSGTGSTISGRNDFAPGSIIVNPNNRTGERYRVERVDGDTVHCLNLTTNLKQTFEMDNLIGKWQLGKKAA